MAWDVTSLTLAADAIAGQTLYAALFNGDPAGAGTEVTGGTPAYARKLLTYPSGANPATVQVTFDVPAGATFDHAAVFDAATLGNRKNSGTIPAESYGSQGTYALTVEIPLS